MRGGLKARGRAAYRGAQEGVGGSGGVARQWRAGDRWRLWGVL